MIMITQQQKNTPAKEMQRPDFATFSNPTNPHLAKELLGVPAS